MTAPTHVTFAEFIYLLILTTTGVALSPVNALAVGIASVLPDIDNGGSMIGRALSPLSLRIERRFGHRTLTHSLSMMVFLAFFFMPLLLCAPDLYVVFLIGYITHPLLDTVTINGVKLFYPFSSVRCVFPLEVNHPYRYRTATGSRVDRVLGVIFLLGCIPTFFIARQGYERFIRITQKNIESAVRDYNELSRTNLVWAGIKAHNLLTKEQITGRFEIIGALNSRTLLFRSSDHRLHSLGVEYLSEYVAETVLCERGQPVRIVTRQIDLQNKPLVQVREEIEPGKEHQFFGQLRTPDEFSVPQDGHEFMPVTGSGGTLTFNFAFYDDIRDLGLENIFISRGTLRVRTLIPIDAAIDTVQASVQPAPRYTRVSFQVDAREPLEIVCSRGDTVEAGELLARWGTVIEMRNKIAEARDRVAENEELLRVNSLAAEERLVAALQAARRDSVELETAKRLVRAGYAEPLALEKAQNEFERSQLLAQRTREARTVILRRAKLQDTHLRNEIEVMTAKERKAILASESRAPVRGVVEDLRQSVNSNKTLVLILLRQL